MSFTKLGHFPFSSSSNSGVFGFAIFFLRFDLDPLYPRFHNAPEKKGKLPPPFFDERYLSREFRLARYLESPNFSDYPYKDEIKGPSRMPQKVSRRRRPIPHQGFPNEFGQNLVGVKIKPVLPDGNRPNEKNQKNRIIISIFYYCSAVSGCQGNFG